MTVSSTDSRNEYISAASQTVFNFTFKIFVASDLTAYVTPLGQESDDSTDITIDFIVDPNSINVDAGGFITFNTPLNAGDKVSLTSDIPYDRTVDYQNNGDFLPSTVNGDNDRQVAQIKQILEIVGKTVVFSQSSQNTSSLSLPEPVAGKLLRWLGDLTGLENVDVSELDPNLITSDGIIFSFDSKAEMEASTALIVGMRVRILGYGEAGDGGDNVFKIVSAGTGIDDGGSFIDLDTFQAEGLFPGGNVYVNQFGAVSNLGFGNTDNGTFVSKAEVFLKSRTGAEGGTLRFANRGTGYLMSQVSITSWTGLVIDLNGMPIQMVDTGTNNYIFQLTACVDSRIHNGRAIGTSDTISTYDNANRQAIIGLIGGSGCRVNNVIFEKIISFGIHAEAMTPATTIRGLDVSGCSFLDFPLDATTDEQCGIHLVNGAEYCNTTYNHFQNVPGAQRDVGGANSNFIGNMVMKSNGQFNDNSAAAVYSDSDDNFGKYNVSLNHINHNDNGNRLLVFKGDPANTRNPSYITNNQLLSNGNITTSNAIYLLECSKILLEANNLRENIGIASPAGQELLEVKDSNDIQVMNNFFLGADFAITNDNSTIEYGRNIFEDQDTGPQQKINGGTHKLTKNRTYNMHILSAHTISSTDDSGVTISNTTTGIYEFAHSFGTTNFNIQAVKANITGAANANGFTFEILKRAAVFDIYVRDSSSDTLTDVDFNITITHGTGSDYPLDIV